MKSVLIVGAGFSGSVIAHFLATEGYKVLVVDERNHLGGNCHTFRDDSSGVMVHKYGPHIFHTDDTEVWEFVNRFAKFHPYINRVKTTVNEKVFSLPINLHTINQFFNKTFSPKQAQEFITEMSEDIENPSSFEEQALAYVGRDLYEAFFKGYTKKQWGVSPDELPASILKRLPLRFDYNDNYFSHRFQGIPEEGYTHIIEKLLNHPLIDVELNSKVSRDESFDYDHVFVTGAIDAWFDYAEGDLGYRTLDFKEIRVDGDFQGCAVMNYGDENIPYTRISEHKHFAPWESHEKTIAFKEYSRACGRDDIPYYPIRLVNEKAILQKYIDLARHEKNLSFIGRLGTYRYLDMDVTIREAMDAAKCFIDSGNKALQIPVFFIDPL